ncbi:MAG: hypothetical protein H6772_00845 [Pseudomonadales bacterium]|nr:hypothetical protein [Pseudomonadales bacterium]
MARKKTKKEKQKSEKRSMNTTMVSVSQTGELSLGMVESKKVETKSTTFSQSQVSLLYKDLIKTLITTLIVFGVLVVIFFVTK